MRAYELRPGDSKVLLGELTVRSDSEGLFDVVFWQVSNGSAIEGVGFTIIGSKRTDFLTWSDTDPGLVWASGGQLQLVHDLCARRLALSAAEVARFLSSWKDAFAVYRRSRGSLPPDIEPKAAKSWSGRKPVVAVSRERARRDLF